MQIISRNGRYGLKVYIGRGRYKWVGTFDTRTKAREVGRQEEAKLVSPYRERAGDFLVRWTEEYPRPKRSTQTTYETGARQFRADTEALRVGGRSVIVPQLYMGDITRPIARAYCLVHPSLHSMLRAAFNDALRDGLVRENPFSQLRLPGSRGRRDIKAITEEEIDLLAEIALHEYAPSSFGVSMEVLIYTAAYTGMRPSEIFALEWDWIDFDNEEIDVRLREYNGELDTPKSGVARRIILPGPAEEALWRLSRRDERVFHGKRGGRLTRAKLHHYWRPIAARFEALLPPRRAEELRQARPPRQQRMEFYELRHACATILLERGVSAADVAVQLGHQDGGELVLKTYGHPDENRARDRLRAAFR